MEEKRTISELGNHGCVTARTMMMLPRSCHGLQLIGHKWGSILLSNPIPNLIQVISCQSTLTLSLNSLHAIFFSCFLFLT